MIKFWLIVLLSVSITFAFNPKNSTKNSTLKIRKLVRELQHLNPNQKKVLQKTFLKGTSFDYEYTLTAIAWQESNFNKYTINLNDPSCGVFHIMPKYLIQHIDMEDTSWNQSRLCERLIKDYDFSFSAALFYLKYWENYWKAKKVSKVWSHTVGSYNGGFHPNKKYIKEIRWKIRALKIYFKNQRRKNELLGRNKGSS